MPANDFMRVSEDFYLESHCATRLWIRQADAHVMPVYLLHKIVHLEIQQNWLPNSKRRSTKLTFLPK